MERKTPRFRRRFESFAKKPSTALSQEQEVGTKWKVKRSWRPSQARTGTVITQYLSAIRPAEHASQIDNPDTRKGSGWLNIFGHGSLRQKGDLQTA